jgi:hypothetical protein
MFGIRFIKVQPTTYVFNYKKGEIVREGAGLSFFFFAPTSSLVAVPIGSADAPFMFSEVTADFQEVTIQGQATYRVVDPRKLSQLLNYTLDSSGRNHVSDDPEKLSQRVVNVIRVLTRKEIQRLALKEALRATDELVRSLSAGLAAAPEIASLGLEVIGLSVLAVKPNPETARALEAETRERLLRDADEAIYDRRNAAVEQERAIRENELNTEIAVENKKRQIREAQMEAERAVQEKQHQLQESEMASQISLERKKQDLVALAAQNSRNEADAKAYGAAAMMQAVGGVDPRVLQALASAGMRPEQLVALAFQNLAERAEKIGQLNVTPDLLREVLTAGR